MFGHFTESHIDAGQCIPMHIDMGIDMTYLTANNDTPILQFSSLVLSCLVCCHTVVEHSTKLQSLLGQLRSTPIEQQLRGYQLKAVAIVDLPRATLKVVPPCLCSKSKGVSSINGIKALNSRLTSSERKRTSHLVALILMVGLRHIWTLLQSLIDCAPNIHGILTYP